VTYFPGREAGFKRHGLPSTHQVCRVHGALLWLLSKTVPKTQLRPPICLMIEYFGVATSMAHTLAIVCTKKSIWSIYSDFVNNFLALPCVRRQSCFVNCNCCGYWQSFRLKLWLSFRTKMTSGPGSTPGACTSAWR
jgi:hypothetical protein